MVCNGLKMFWKFEKFVGSKASGHQIRVFLDLTDFIKVGVVFLCRDKDDLCLQVPLHEEGFVSIVQSFYNIKLKISRAWVRPSSAVRLNVDNLDLFVAAHLLRVMLAFYISWVGRYVHVQLFHFYESDFWFSRILGLS